MGKLPFSKHINFNAVRKPRVNGKVFKRVKSFRDPVKAEEYLNGLLRVWKSKRYVPFIEETPVGLSKRFGSVYRVCVPSGMEVK